jgi:hypothetical protein
MLTGETCDISFICEFGWYDYVWYLSPEDQSLERKRIGRRLKTVFGAPVRKLGAYPQIREGYSPNAPYKWQ